MYNQINHSIIPKSYNCNTLEGNWYEDRCVSNFDKDKKKNYSLKSPFSWQYETTYNQVGSTSKDYPSVKERFAVANDNYINFQNKSNDMFVSVYKNSYNPNYREGLTYIPSHKGYFDNDKNQEELSKYRETWTKRDHSFRTTYNDDLLKTYLKK